MSAVACAWIFSFESPYSSRSSSGIPEWVEKMSGTEISPYRAVSPFLDHHFRDRVFRVRRCGSLPELPGSRPYAGSPLRSPLRREAGSCAARRPVPVSVLPQPFGRPERRVERKPRHEDRQILARILPHRRFSDPEPVGPAGRAPASDPARSARSTDRRASHSASQALSWRQRRKD